MDWFIPLQEPLLRFTKIFDSMEEFAAILNSVKSKYASYQRGDDKSWFGELLSAEHRLFLELHEVSAGLVDASADVIEDCGLTDEVSGFLSTPVDGDKGFVEDLRLLVSSNPQLLSHELTAPCFALPIMDANHKFIFRLVSLKPLLPESANFQGFGSSIIPIDVFVIIYGTALEFLETARRIIDACGLEVLGTSRTEAVSTVRLQESAAQVRPSATPVPRDPASCQWQDAYRGMLDAFLIQVKLVDADSPDAPGKLRDYALNLANSLDDIRENCSLP